MKNQILTVATLAFCLALNGCFGLFDSGSERIAGNYHVLWIDLQENQGIYEEEGTDGPLIGIIPEYVFEVGHDDNFIIAKQHPTSGFESGYQINTEITNYYLVNMNIKSEKVTGPLTLTEFECLRERLGISDIKFEMKYPERP